MKAYVLALANVHDNIDAIRPVAVAEDEGRLRAWEHEQRAPKPYRAEPGEDFFGQFHAYTLVYKPDSPLQWFNPHDEGCEINGGIFVVDIDLSTLAHLPSGITVVK